MDTETMIRNLESVEERHKSDAVYTGQLNIAEMVHDVRKRLERLKPYEDTGLTPEQIRELKERNTPKPLMERHYEEPREKPYIKYTCPNGCKNQPLRNSNFCSLCGQRLKWEE